MARITFIDQAGAEHLVDVPSGISLMDGGVRNNVPGIVAECGGSCSCGTCHVHVAEEWIDRLEAPDPTETELVEFMENHRATSRLSCQIVVEDELDGLIVHVAPNEI